MSDGEVVEKKFLLGTKEDAKLPALIKIAYERGLIKQPTLEEYIYFSLNCSANSLLQLHKLKKGVHFRCFACGSQV
jgi:hypothetical protein